MRGSDLRIAVLQAAAHPWLLASSVITAACTELTRATKMNTHAFIVSVHTLFIVGPSGGAGEKLFVFVCVCCLGKRAHKDSDEQ